VSDSPAATYLDQIVEHCQKARFTGLLRMRTRQGEGELWFLSGAKDDARFGVSHGDEAVERMARASDPTFELVPRLPPPSAGSKKSYPLEGALGELRPVDLFRLCEMNAITCSLELRRGSTSAVAHYQVGELLSVESESADERAIGAMLEWSEGSYRFELPPLELPAGVPVYTPPRAPLMSAEEARTQPAARQEPSAQAAPRQPDRKAAARRKAETEAARRKADQEAAAKRKAEAEAARRKADQEAAAKRKAEAEAAARRKVEEEAAAKQRAAEQAIRRKAVSVHRQIAVGGGSAPGQFWEAPRPAPRAPEPDPAPPAADAPTESDRRVDEIADAWRKAEEAAAAQQAAAGAAAPEPRAPAEAEPPPAEPAAAPSERPAPPAAAETEPEAPAPPPEPAAEPRVQRRPSVERPEPIVPSEPPPPRRSLWPVVLVALVVLAALAYFYGTR
jgi:hypothetical protein